MISALCLVYLAQKSGEFDFLGEKSGATTAEVGAPDFSFSPSDNDPVLSQERALHILYGDAHGGGHKSGLGIPCKSEFPADWDDTQITKSVKRLAANDNADWTRQDNGYYVSEQMDSGVKVRVVLGRNKDEIITAYPVNIPRNPCPANDNKNR